MINFIARSSWGLNLYLKIFLPKCQIFLTFFFLINFSFYSFSADTKNPWNICHNKNEMIWEKKMKKEQLVDENLSK